MKENIVYLLTNTSREEGKRFYIGSKQECSLEMVDGVYTILDRNNKPYFSSSTSLEMRDDMRNGHVFEATILEQGVGRKDLLEVENGYITRANAVSSDEYYNKSNAVLNCHDQGAVANKYGETVKDLASRNSSMGKRDNGAISLGFNNFGELHMHIRELLKSGMNYKQVSDTLGKYRHYAARVLENTNLDKAYSELEHEDLYKEKLRSYVFNGCSLYYACELLGIEISSGRIFLGDYNRLYEKSFKAAAKNNMSKEEMEKVVIKHIISAKDGYGYKEAAQELNLSLETVKRYAHRWIKKLCKDNPELLKQPQING